MAYYEALGYEIPRENTRRDGPVIVRGTKILVSVDHLPKKSHVKLTKICDLCGTVIPNIPYRDILKCRDSYGRDSCRACSVSILNRERAMRKAESGINLVTKFPELCEEWHPFKNGDVRPEDITPNSHIRAWWLCSDCHHEWEASIYARSGGTACPICRKSRGERRIYQYLRSRCIPFEAQVAYVDLVGLGGMPLLFDFVVGGKVGPWMFIEYDGEQHFRPTSFGDNDADPVKQYQKLREHDERKSQWCEMIGVPLLRIKYTDLENIEAILETSIAEIIGGSIKWE